MPGIVKSVASVSVLLVEGKSIVKLFKPTPVSSNPAIVFKAELYVRLYLFYWLVYGWF